LDVYEGQKFEITWPKGRLSNGGVPALQFLIGTHRGK
jgi:hypothetical protein